MKEVKTLKKILKAAPHKDCMRIALSDFSSDCTKATQEYSRISRSFRARLRKICKQDVRQAVRRDLISGSLVIIIVRQLISDRED